GETPRDGANYCSRLPTGSPWSTDQSLHYQPVAHGHGLSQQHHKSASVGGGDTALGGPELVHPPADTQVDHEQVCFRATGANGERAIRIDRDAPRAMRIPPPISVTHVQSSRSVVVKLQSHELPNSASVAKYEKPPAPNPYSWTLPALRATCGPARSEVM